jgi:Bacterial capsule synthesis protein PGA_cap
MRTMLVRGTGHRRGRPAAAAVGAVLLMLAGCDSGRQPTAVTASSTPVAGPSIVVATVPPATSSTRSSPPQRPTPRTVTVLGSGDVLIHPPLWEQAAADARARGESGYDFGPIYAAIAQVIRHVDLATCELETPLASPQGPFTGYPTFNAPPQVLTALRAVGYRSCTTASNHTLDAGPAGVTRTLNELDQAGLRHTGSARSAQEADTPLIITMPNGARVAQLAYAFGFNGIPLPAGMPWLANLTDVPTILAAAHRAKAAGADIVVLSMHWGIEYNHGVTAEQASEARQLLASPDIDVILGDHAHAIEPFEQINGKWVVYCMGNQIARHAEPVNDNREGVMPRFTFTEVAPHRWRITKAEAIPTWMQITPTLRLIDLPAALADPATPAARRFEYQAAYDRIAGYLDARGGRAHGLIVVR